MDKTKTEMIREMREKQSPNRVKGGYKTTVTKIVVQRKDGYGFAPYVLTNRVAKPVQGKMAKRIRVNNKIVSWASLRRMSVDEVFGIYQTLLSDLGEEE
jgi:hypothetical protein